MEIKVKILDNLKKCIDEYWEKHPEERPTIQWCRQLSRKAIPCSGTPNYCAC